MLINDDFSLHRQITTQQNIKEIRIGPNIIDYFTYTVFLLAEATVHLLDELRLPRLEERDLG